MTVTPRECWDPNSTEFLYDPFSYVLVWWPPEGGGVCWNKLYTIFEYVSALFSKRNKLCSSVGEFTICEKDIWDADSSRTGGDVRCLHQCPIQMVPNQTQPFCGCSINKQTFTWIKVEMRSLTAVDNFTPKLTSWYFNQKGWLETKSQMGIKHLKTNSTERWY